MMFYHWLGEEAESLEVEIETLRQLAREAYENDLTDPQADE